MFFMKAIRLIALILIVTIPGTRLMSQVKNYDQQWKKVDDLIQKKNLPKSALEEVKKIYSLAKKENRRV